MENITYAKIKGETIIGVGESLATGSVEIFSQYWCIASKTQDSNYRPFAVNAPFYRSNWKKFSEYAFNYTGSVCLPYNYQIRPTQPILLSSNRTKLEV